MVAPTHSLAGRFIPPPESVLTGRSRLVHFTRHDAAELVRLGIVQEDTSTELLNGLIVLTDRSATGEDVLSVGKNHRLVVERLSNLRIPINSLLRHVETQQPLVCSDTHVPQPDFMVLRGTLDEYQDLPTAADAYCVIEVADSSYERESDEKLKGYAKARIQQYIIINLGNRTAEIYTNPNAVGVYSKSEILSDDKSLALRVGEGEFFTVRLMGVLP